MIEIGKKYRVVGMDDDYSVINDSIVRVGGIDPLISSAFCQGDTWSAWLYFRNLSPILDTAKIHLTNDAPIPTYATDGSAGFDIASNETITINPGHWVRISTGIHIQLPPDQELQIRSRSGIAYRKGLVVHQGIGTIDSDYRGEVQVMIRNTGMNAVTVNRGDRIAQGVIAPVIRVDFEVVDKLDDTVRGDGGFGSSGI